MFKSALLLAIAKIYLGILTSEVGSRRDLYEGNPCTLENGERGVCKQLPHCPIRMQEVIKGMRDSDSKNRCGFYGFMEVVCCPLNGGEGPVGPVGPVGAGQSTARPGQSTLRPGPNPFILSQNPARPGQNTVRPLQTTGRPVINPARPIQTTDSSAANRVRPADRGCLDATKIKAQHAEDSYFFIVVYQGIKALAGEFPFMVALGFPNTEDDQQSISYNCGGTLVSRQHVLTAAHCVNNIQGLVPTEVFMGHTELDSNSSSVQRIPISSIVWHPQYRRSRGYNDVAVLTLQRPVATSIDTQPACLYTQPLNALNTVDQKTVTVTGWGATSVDIDKSHYLLKSPKLNISDNGECNRFYSNFARLPNGITDTLICTVDSDKERGADACEGDSGGPLVAEVSGTKYVIGITAFGQICGGFAPGVYTAVYPYLAWIEQQVWGSN